jgi:hypothetical protein
MTEFVSRKMSEKDSVPHAAAMASCSASYQNSFAIVAKLPSSGIMAKPKLSMANC